MSVYVAKENIVKKETQSISFEKNEMQELEDEPSQPKKYVSSHQNWQS